MQAPMTDTKTTVKSRRKARRANAIVWPVAILLLVGGGWYGYNKWQFEKNHIYTDNAQVQGIITRVLSPESGFVEKVYVQSNQPVEQGELLVQLSDFPYQLDLQRAQAQYNILQSQVGSDDNAGLNQAQLASAQAKLEVIQSQLAAAKTAASQASDDLARKQMQFQNGNINDSQMQMAKATHDQAAARLLTLQKEAYAAQQEVAEADASGKLGSYNLSSAKVQLDQAKERLSYTKVKSPIKGVVARSHVQPGVLVQSAEYLMSVVSLENVWIVANIKEGDFTKVQPGASVDVIINAYPGKVFKGKVNSTSPATGDMFALIPKDNASGNFIKVPALIPVQIEFLGLPQAEYQILPGMSAEVTIQVRERSDKQPAAKPSGKSVHTSNPPESSESKTAASKPATVDAEASAKSDSKAVAETKSPKSTSTKK